MGIGRQVGFSLIAFLTLGCSRLQTTPSINPVGQSKQLDASAPQDPKKALLLLSLGDVQRQAHKDCWILLPMERSGRGYRIDFTRPEFQHDRFIYRSEMMSAIEIYHEGLKEEKASDWPATLARVLAAVGTWGSLTVGFLNPALLPVAVVAAGLSMAPTFLGPMIVEFKGVQAMRQAMKPQHTLLVAAGGKDRTDFKPLEADFLRIIEDIPYGDLEDNALRSEGQGSLAEILDRTRPTERFCESAYAQLAPQTANGEGPKE